jgi:nitrous oxide reductase
MYNTGNKDQVPESRRDFLKKAALAGAGTVLGSSIIANESQAIPAAATNRLHSYYQ